MNLRFVLAVILLLAGVIAVCVGNRTIVDGGTEYRPPIRKIGLGVLGASALFFLFSCMRLVSPGETGIPVVFGKAGAPLGAGVHFVNPFTTVETLSVRTENYTMSGISNEGNKEGNDAVDVLGSDGAGGQVDATVLYHLDKGSASQVFLETGTNYSEKILRPTTRTCIRDAFAHTPMVIAATTGRTEVSTAVTTCIERELTPKGLILEAFQLRDVHLGETVQNSINAKVSSQQLAEQQQFELLKTTQQAEIARVDAQGKADAQQIIACGGSTVPIDDKGGTKVIPNLGAACQNNLSAAYLQYLYIQTLQKVAEGQNHSTLILPFDQNLTPLLNLDGPR